MWFEARLIQKAARDPDAFAKLYQKYIQPSYAFIAFRVSDCAHAEDLTSELWIKILKHLPELKSSKPEVFRAWLFTMARNLVTDFHRTRARQETLEMTENIPTEPSQETDFVEQALLRNLVKQLPQKQAEIVSLRFFSGLRNKEIAGQLDISEKTVASNLSRALKQLKEWLCKFKQ